MSSFTSNSRNKWILILAAVAILSAEFTIRLFGTSLSVDLEHIRDLPLIAEDLKNAQDPTILFLGNSLTREGVDPTIVSSELHRRLSIPVHVSRAYPDDTSITEWPYALKHYFLDRGSKPDVLILSVGIHRLDDSRASRPHRLGGYYADLGDLKYLLRHDLLTLGDRIDFFLSYASSAFRNRTRVSKRILNFIVPDYREFARSVNTTIKLDEKPHQETDPSNQTFHRLEYLADLARSHGIHIILVAMPTRPPSFHEFQPEEIAMINHLGITLIDLREYPELTPEMFKDHVHLNERGAEIHSRRLAEHLAKPLEAILP